MKYLITALLLVSLQAQAVPAQDKDIFVRCAAWASLAKLTKSHELHTEAAEILGATTENSVKETMWAVGYEAGSTNSASQIYYSICPDREKYAKDLISQSKT